MIRQSCIQIPARLVTALSLAIAQVAPVAAQSLPTGASVQSGSATVSAAGNVMQVNQSTNRAVINWNTFNVGANSSVYFNQPSTSSSVLNRVTGDAPSNIAGLLQGNGSVYIVNPNGVAITPSGRVIMGGGFVASTLALTDADYQQGKLAFRGDGASAAVSNEGEITVGAGGVVGLLGGSVSNAGKIVAPLGRIGLGSGEQATLDLYGDGFLSIALPTSATTADGKALVDVSGSVSAAGGRVAIAAATAREALRQAVNISGEVSARGASGRNGNVMIGGGAGGAVRVTGKVSAASGADSGGARAGKVAISGNTVTLDKGAEVSARSESATGGAVLVTGENIRMADAKIDVSGETGGGVVRIGGERQGGDGLPRALTTEVTNQAVIDADARASGKGGDVVVWADGLTTYAGLITARGGAKGGDGGEAEVSGKALLNFTEAGRVDLSAAKGAAGTLLLDPYNVIIDAATGDAATSTYTPSTDSTILASTITNLLAAGTNVTINTTGAGASAGDITVNAGLTWSSDASLTLNASTATGTIRINSNITSGGALALNAKDFALASGVTVTNNGSVRGVFSGTATINGAITGTRGINLSATTAIIVASGGALISGSFGVALSAGTINISGTATTNTASTWTASTGDLTIANGASVSLNSAVQLSLVSSAGNVIIGSASLPKDPGTSLAISTPGAGKFTSLSGSLIDVNSFTAGAVRLDGNVTISSASNSTITSLTGGSGFTLTKGGQGLLLINGPTTGFAGSLRIVNGMVNFSDKASFTSANMLSKITLAPAAAASTNGISFTFADAAGSSSGSAFGWADLATYMASSTLIESGNANTANTAIGVNTSNAALNLNDSALATMKAASATFTTDAKKFNLAKIGSANDLTISGATGAAGPSAAFKGYRVFSGGLRIADATILNDIALSTASASSSSIATLKVGLSSGQTASTCASTFIDSTSKYSGMSIALDAKVTLTVPTTFNNGVFNRDVTGGSGKIQVVTAGGATDISFPDFFSISNRPDFVLGAGVKLTAVMQGILGNVHYVPAFTALNTGDVSSVNLTYPGDVQFTGAIDRSINVTFNVNPASEAIIAVANVGVIGSRATLAEATNFKSSIDPNNNAYTWIENVDLSKFALIRTRRQLWVTSTSRTFHSMMEA